MTLMLLAFTATRIRADANDDARKAIQAAYKKFDTALSHKDRAGFLSIYTSNFEQVSEKGVKMPLQQIQQMSVQLFAMARSINVSTVVQSIAVKGNAATARVKSHAMVVLTNPQTKKTGTMTTDEVSDDIWVKTAKGWLQKHSKTVK